MILRRLHLESAEEHRRNKKRGNASPPQHGGCQFKPILLGTLRLARPGLHTTQSSIV